MQTIEEWRAIAGLDNYEVSSMGQVRNSTTQHIIQCDNRTNQVDLQLNGKDTYFRVPDLVAAAFLGIDLFDAFHSRVLFVDGDSHNWELSNLYVEDLSDIKGEIWSDIELPGYADIPKYQISSKGRVKRLAWVEEYYRGGSLVKRAHPTMLMSSNSHDPYLAVLLTPKGCSHPISKTIHRLVATAFIPNPDNKPQVNHIDGNKHNNCVENLEWVTRSENQLHAIRTGLQDIYKHAIAVMCIETQEAFPSMVSAANAIGVDPELLRVPLRRTGKYYNKKLNLTFTYA